MNKEVSLVVVVTIALMVAASGCAGGPDPIVKAVRPPPPPPAVPKQINEPLDPAMCAKATQVLDQSLASSDPILRANAIEAMQNTIGKEGANSILQGLKDPDGVVRFASCMAAGTLQLTTAKPTIAEMAHTDTDTSVRVAARFALHRFGDTRLSHDLERFAIDANKWVRANTAMVLGRLGEKSALNVLRAMVNDRERVVRVQVFESMWRLGDEKEGLENLVASSVSQAPDDQIIAILALAEPRDQRVSGHIHAKLVSDYPETSLAAARAMGMLGSDAGYTIAMNATRSTDPRQKAMAALALGAIGRSDAQPALSRLLSDQDRNVQLAAATGLLQLKPPRA